MNNQVYLEEIRREFLSILYKYIPDEMIKNDGYTGLSFDAELSNENRSFVNSQYYYNGEKKFIHWTSIQSLMSIINYREIRFYNLHNSSDENEFKYAAKKLGVYDNDIDYSKRNLYTFSFCKAMELNNSDLWKEYGKDYEGVALEFEIVNDQNKWNRFMLSKVYYEIPNRFVKLKKELKILRKKYPSASFKVDLGKLIAFHKRPDFLKELEIRLSIYFPFKTEEEHNKSSNTEFRFDNNRPRVTNYLGLKLWVDNSSAYVKEYNPEYDRILNVNESYFVEKPQIHITNIYFGKNCGITNEKFRFFREKLQQIIKIKLGYVVDLESTLFG